MESPQKRPPSLYSQTPLNKSSKAQHLQATPGQSAHMNRGAMRSSLENPQMMKSIDVQPQSLMKAIDGAKSQKQFAPMGDGISGRSVNEPTIMYSARNKRNGADAHSRSSTQMHTVKKDVARRSTMSVSSTPNLMQKKASAKTFGIQGYRAAKCGLPQREPNYTIPKDKNSNFFNHVTRSSKYIPAPSTYHKPLSWKTTNGNFGIGPARQTFTDEAAKHSRQVPSCSQYHPEQKNRLLLGQLCKTEGVDYLSDHEYLSRYNPGPATYKADPSVVKPRITAYKMPASQGKKDWRPKKTKEPDCASYEVQKAKAYVGRSPFIHKFAHPKEEGRQVTKETYTTIIARQKKNIPGVGSYTPKLDYVAVPYGRKRL